ncbi:2Fe-2S iron-sulfur cluster-binding protein [Methanothrix sp.]
MSEFKLTIDGREVEVLKGSTIPEAARKAGVIAPALYAAAPKSPRRE